MIDHGAAIPTPTHVTVTGGTGFIGGWVLQTLTRTLPDARVRVLIRSRRQPLPTNRCDPFPGDLTDPGSLAGITDASRVLLHCAAYVGPDPLVAESVNLRGTEALLSDARRAGVERVLYVSTASVYGRGPFTNAVHEDLSLAPGSAASRTRMAAEELVRAAGGTVLRPYLVYGSGDRWVGPRLAHLAVALGDQVHAFQSLVSMVDVRRLADAVVAAALRLPETDGGRVYDCNHPEPVIAAQCLSWFRSMLPKQARRQASGRGRLTSGLPAGHDAAMVAVDHWFDSTRVWQDCGVPAGEPFATAVTDHTPWYREACSQGLPRERS